MSATIVSQQQESGVEVVVRGRRRKVKVPNRQERFDSLYNAILSLTDELAQNGFAKFLGSPGNVKSISKPVHDPKTDGWIGHVEEPLGVYINRVSIKDNYNQRPPFDHANDPIYRRLIRDFISGAAMPESKIAALKSGKPDRRLESLDDKDVIYSVIDGLQRLYCFCVALLLVWHRDQAVQRGLISKDAWDYFSEAVSKVGDAKSATEALLMRPIRYEIFYNIDLAGLLHYMVTFNTGQRRMSLPVQLEIMRKPLIQELQSRGIPIWFETDTRPGVTRPKDKFTAADLVLATEAFIGSNPQVTASNEAENRLNMNQAFLDNVGDITDVAETLKRIATEVHPEIMKVYADDPSKRYILSGSATFLLGVCAACGYVRNRNNMKMLDGALDKLADLLRRPVEDPLKLEAYQQALQTITASRGKAVRRLVYDTFLRFFSGATIELDWLDTARQITGSNF